MIFQIQYNVRDCSTLPAALQVGTGSNNYVKKNFPLKLNCHLDPILLASTFFSNFYSFLCVSLGLLSLPLLNVADLHGAVTCNQRKGIVRIEKVLCRLGPQVLAVVFGL